MTIEPRKAAATLALALLAACSSGGAGSSGAPSPDDREMNSLLGLKKTYAGVVSGVEVRGTAAMIYVDANQLNQMDEVKDLELKALALKQFEQAWKRNHPGAHAKLSVSFRDFTGAEIVTKHGKV
jgi:hypothetical protein